MQKSQKNEKYLKKTPQLDVPDQPKRKNTQMKYKLQTSLGWDKWKVHSLSLVTPEFCERMRIKATQMQKQIEKKKILPLETVQLSSFRHELRDLSKLKASVETAQSNNRLIKQIEQISEQKINSFFKTFTEERLNLEEFNAKELSRA